MSDWKSRAISTNDSPPSDWKSRAVSIAETPDTSLGNKVQTAAEGFGNAATLGYLPQLQAAAGKLMGRPESYTDLRDENTARIEQESKANPKSYLGGEIGGALTTGIAASGVMPAASGVFGRLAQGAAAGGLMGAAQNPGDTKGQLSGAQIPQRLENAKSGAEFGAAAQGLGEAASKLGSMGNGLLSFSKERAVAALGADKPAIKRLLAQDPTGLEGKSVQDLGDFALKNKLVQMGDTIDSVAEKTASLKNNLGNKIGSIYDRAAQKLDDPKFYAGLNDSQKGLVDQAKFVPTDMAKEFVDKLTTGLKGTATKKQAINATGDVLENLTELGSAPVSIKDIQKFKASLDDLIFESNKSPATLPEKKQGLYQLRDFLKDKIQNAVTAVDKIGGSENISGLKQANQDYGKASVALKMAKNRMSGEGGNNILSLTDKMAGIGGAVIGGEEGYRHGGIGGAMEGAALGAGAGLISKAGRTYGRPIMAKSAQMAGNIANGISKYTPGSGLLPKANQIPAGAGLIGARYGRQ